jgi:hypothetical protein
MAGALALKGNAVLKVVHLGVLAPCPAGALDVALGGAERTEAHHKRTLGHVYALLQRRCAYLIYATAHIVMYCPTN